MWRMQDGNRVLTEAEWKLFKAGLRMLWDSIEEDMQRESDNTETGVPVFDRLTPEQKLVLLADTARALRDLDTPMPHHTAVNEGSIAAVFSMVQVELDTELDIAGMESDDEKPTEIRRMLRAVGEESEGREVPLPTASRSAGFVVGVKVIAGAAGGSSGSACGDVGEPDPVPGLRKRVDPSASVWSPS